MVSVEPTGRSGLREVVILLAGFLLTIAATWPLVIELGSVNRLADRTHDDYVYYWNSWWFYRALFEIHTSPLFCSEIFHPYGANLAASPLASTYALISLPIQAILGNLEGAVVTVKVIAFLTFGLAIHGTSLLLRTLGIPLWAAFLGGCLFAFAPFRFLHLCRVHYLAGCLTPYCLWLVIRAMRGEGLAVPCLAGLLIAVMGASDASLLPELAVAGVFLWWWLWRQGAPALRSLRRAFLIALFGGVFFAPILVPFLMAQEVEPAATSTLEFKTEPSSLQLLFSPDLNGLSYYLSPSLHEAVVSSNSPRWQETTRIRGIHHSYRPPPAKPLLERSAALVTIMMALVAVALGLSQRRFWPFACLAMVGFVLALGPYRNLGDDVVRMPYYYLSQIVPGMRAGRYPPANLRLFYLGLAVVAAAGLSRGWPWLRWGAWLTLALVVAGWCTRPLRFEPIRKDAVYETMAADPAAGAVLDFPQRGSALRHMALGQILHQRPLKGGPLHRVAAEATVFLDNSPVVSRFLEPPRSGQERLPTLRAEMEANVRMLRENGVRYVLARRVATVMAAERLERLFQYLSHHEGLSMTSKEPTAIVFRVNDP